MLLNIEKPGELFYFQMLSNTEKSGEQDLGYRKNLTDPVAPTFNIFNPLPDDKF